jgi:hypothetical protein
MSREVANPVDRVLEDARRVGNEYCWPAKGAREVITALRDLEQATLGFEVWHFENPVGPRVVRISGYEVDLEQPWPDVVRDSSAAALAELSDADTGWINLTWISAREARNFKAHGNFADDETLRD